MHRYRVDDISDVMISFSPTTQHFYGEKKCISDTKMSFLEQFTVDRKSKIILIFCWLSINKQKNAIS